MADTDGIVKPCLQRNGYADSFAFCINLRDTIRTEGTSWPEMGSRSELDPLLDDMADSFESQHMKVGIDGLPHGMVREWKRPQYDYQAMQMVVCHKLMSDHPTSYPEGCPELPRWLCRSPSGSYQYKCDTWSRPRRTSKSKRDAAHDFDDARAELRYNLLQMFLSNTNRSSAIALPLSKADAEAIKATSPRLEDKDEDLVDDPSNLVVFRPPSATYASSGNTKDVEAPRSRDIFLALPSGLLLSGKSAKDVIPQLFV